MNTLKIRCYHCEEANEYGSEKLLEQSLACADCGRQMEVDLSTAAALLVANGWTCVPPKGDGE